MIDVEPHVDHRGYFARTWCAREFAEHGLSERMVQGSISFNHKAGTLRGMHLHSESFPQTRLVRAIQGSTYFVILDLRKDSSHFKKHESFTVEAESHRALYVPAGVALGYQTLEDDTLIYYLMPEFYTPEYETGVRWNDPAFDISWPTAERIIVDRDANYPDFRVD